MRAFWSDPYLWIHAAGLAGVPVCLLLCLLGLAVGDPLLPAWLELGLIAIVGIVPIAWMQLQKPFYIFSLLAVALKPEKLTDDQRRILVLLKTRPSLAGVVAGAVVLLLLLRKLYDVAPIAADLTPLPPSWRPLGLLVAAIAFLFSNLFLQVPLSVIQVLLASDAEFAATAPYALENIAQSFSVFGLQVNQIVPPLAAPATIAEPLSVSETSSQTVDSAPATNSDATPDA